MVGITFAKLVGDAFGTHGIYDEYIVFNKYPFLDSHQSIPLHVR